MARGWVLGAAVLIVLATACGDGRLGSPIRPTPTILPSGTTPSPPTSPAPSPGPTGPAPTMPPTPAATGTFNGSISLAPAARVRSGPGMDMPVMDLEPVGKEEVFDAWYRRVDDPPQADAITGRLEWWSRDWYRLADHRGWIHSGAVRGLPPAGLGELAWQRASVLPQAAAALMPIALDRQDQAASCEVAALKMALAGQGIMTSEQALLGLIGIDSRPPVEDERGNIIRWGNPNLGFVGDPGGSQADHTGYGVYAAPIARAAIAAGGRVRRSGTGVEAADLYAAVLAGHPVVAWVTSDYTRSSTRTWTAWDGTAIAYVLKEHAVTLIGVTPGWVLINDPWWGQLWKSKAEFEAAYSSFGQMAVVL